MRSHYLLFQGVKSANMKIFKDFCNAEKTNKNKQKCRSYFVSFLMPAKVTLIRKIFK